MHTAKHKAMEAAGGKVGDVADFLEMCDGERQLLDRQIAIMPPKQKATCTCGTLERASREPNHAIRWGETVGEYYIAWGDRQQMIIFYCPSCGGSAPPSRRDSLFHTITQAERERLIELTSGIQTVQEVISTFGEPDLRLSMSTITPEKACQPETTQSFPQWVFSNLSEVAEVRITIYPTDRVGFSFRAKEVGRGAD
jgi:hypothetical protein